MQFNKETSFFQRILIVAKMLKIRIQHRKLFSTKLSQYTPSPAPAAPPEPDTATAFTDRKVNRGEALKLLSGGFAAAAATVAGGCGDLESAPAVEKQKLNWEEYFKSNYRLMNDEEKQETVRRLERLSQLEHDVQVQIDTTPPKTRVLYGYAFNISKCRGYMDCISACLKENNQDRNSNMQYIKIFEVEDGRMNLEEGDAHFFHEVPAAGHFYMGTQCFQCENPPCVKVCPVQATWREPDGIVVVDYDWCIGCRYCESACPYHARRFNWADPFVPVAEINKKQHYLGNRMRKQGVVEKCTFCIQRTRAGKSPACVEACPTGARVFGNLLDPNSEIRYILENKRVFRLKEELGAEPKFWYYMD